MLARIRRAVLAAVVGALAAALSLVAAYALHPGLVFEMDRPLPSFISGMSTNERDALGTFNWTSGRVIMDVPGLDRQVSWSCTIRFRGARPPGEPHPTLTVNVDGQPGSVIAATDEYQELGVVLPARTMSGATLTMTIAPTFVPGGGDSRVLGVQVDRLVCRPESALLRPPANTLSYATVAAAIFAAGLALLGLSLSSAMFAAVIIALGQTVMLAISSGMYGNYASRLPWLALAIVASALALSRAIHIWRREALTSSARFVVAASASVLFLKILGLLHPAKPVIDAMFNMHKLDEVLAGRFWHLQPVSGVDMPYAIGLYVFAAPWAWLTTDHMALIRVVTASADVIAGALLYPVMVRAWGDRRAASLAAVLFQLVPLPFSTLGNANLPNMFGQSMALATIAAAVTWRVDWQRPAALVGLTILTTWALCSHVSTITLLSATLGVLVLMYFWWGDAERRRAAVAIIVVTAISLVISWFLFYSHFLDVFVNAFTTMFSGGGAAPVARTLNAAEIIKGNMTMPERVWDLGRQAVNNFSVPLLLLAAVGVWTVVRNRLRDRLTCALVAWATVWIVLSASTAFARVDASYVRYAAEFLGRINLATVPLVAILAGRGAAAGWDASTPNSVRRLLQYLSVILMAWTLEGAVQAWLGWFYR